MASALPDGVVQCARHGIVHRAEQPCRVCVPKPCSSCDTVPIHTAMQQRMVGDVVQRFYRCTACGVEFTVVDDCIQNPHQWIWCLVHRGQMQCSHLCDQHPNARQHEDECTDPEPEPVPAPHDFNCWNCGKYIEAGRLGLLISDDGDLNWICGEGCPERPSA